MKTHLVIGSDGLVGSALVNQLKQEGVSAIGTTRRSEKVAPQNIYLNLEDPAESWKLPNGISVAVICAGATRVGLCRENPGRTATLNCVQLPKLIQILVERGIFIVYLSTNQVFDGSVPQCQPDLKYSPKTEYGRQKAIAEEKIKSFGSNVSIVRFSKIIENRPALFNQWAKMLKNHKIIKPFLNMSLSPVPMCFVIKVLRLVMNQKVSGVLQVTGNSDISYAEVAKIGAQILGATPDLVQPKTTQESGYPDYVPIHTTLDIERLKMELGVFPPDVIETVQEAFKAYFS